jgi:superfamily II DNA or RNA helicase
MLTLRDYQKDCVDSTRDAFINYIQEDKQTRVLNVLPTGAGKTVIFGNIIQSFLEKRPYSRVAVVSHLGLLVSQTAQRFREDWGVESGVLQADVYPSHRDRCIVTTMQSFREVNKLKSWAHQLPMFSKEINRLNIELIIVDEAHYVGSDSYEKIMSNFPTATILGFTATPFRENKLMSNFFDVVAYTISMQELIDMGYLVRPNLNLVPFQAKDEAQVYKAVIDIYSKNHQANKDKAVVYCKTIKQAKDLRNILVEHGISSEAVTSKLTGKGRDDLLADFRNGDGPEILTTVDVLTAGFDSPNLAAIFMPWKVNSVTRYLQRIGRGLRPHPGKTSCEIYVGSDSPGVKKGFWEKVHKQTMNAGRREWDNLLDELEYGKDSMTADQYSWTMDTVNLAKDVKSKGMTGLYDMIIQKEIPQELLGNLISSPPVKSRYRKSNPATDKQKYYLQRIGVDATNLSSHEASSIIQADMEMKGLVKKEDRVPAGKWEGTPFNKVPYMYWQILGKNCPQSATYQAYLTWKRRISGNQVRANN